METPKRLALEISALSKTYSGSNNTSVEALKSISLQVSEGELLCIVGKSGCGKSTLLNILAGIIEPTSGKVLVFGELPLKARSKISYMQQRAMLLPYRTVFQNAAIGLELRDSLTTQSLKKVSDFVDRLGLVEFSHHYPHELSGGMQQRVALTRTLAVDSPMLLCDEPFISLDFDTRLELENLFWLIVKKNKKTSIFVTHDIESAVAIGDRVVVMSPRPGSISRIIDLDKEFVHTEPIKRRESPNLPRFFSEVWQALRESETSNDKG